MSIVATIIHGFEFTYESTVHTHNMLSDRVRPGDFEHHIVCGPNTKENRLKLITSFNNMSSELKLFEHDNNPGAMVLGLFIDMYVCHISTIDTEQILSADDDTKARLVTLTKDLFGVDNINHFGPYTFLLIANRITSD